MLLLFDIDGTLLLRAAREHGEALLAALGRVHGVTAPAAGVPTAGRTDPAIARSLLELAGVPEDEIAAGAAEVARLCVEEFDARCPADLSATVSPGSVELLHELAGRDGVRLALLTGNLEPVGRLKLERAGLGGFFVVGQGAFGSDHEDRGRLPAIARRRAAVDGVDWPGERTVVIGDTPLDIACARAGAVRCVAVATGHFTAEDLREADAVAADASAILRSLDGLPPV